MLSRKVPPLAIYNKVWATIPWMKEEVYIIYPLYPVRKRNLPFGIRVSPSKLKFQSRRFPMGVRNVSDCGGVSFPLRYFTSSILAPPGP